ncbi:MAG: glycosyltransferase family 39 protein, partial [Candidatus Sumerlaeota bacterium]|nr:glycosyltransferase family 39 protein [Candidatus Sumerlaeota bacterium]
AAAGLTAGLALLSKFHAWVLLPPLWGFLVLSPEHRRAWKTPGPYGAAAIALAVLSPNLLWNARHDWLNYVFQWNRSGLPRAGFHPAYAVELIAGTALALSPLVFVAMVCGVWRGFRLWRTAREPRVLFLLCAGLPLVAFLFALSFGVQISLHWPAGGYGALLILAVGLMERGELFGPRFRRAMLGMAAAMTLALHLAPYLVMSLPDDSGVSWIPETLKMSRVKSKFVGWREIGEKARSLRDEMNVQTPTVIMAKTRHMAAVLAFYSQCPTSVFAAEADSAHNFGLWFREAGGLRGVNAVFIIRKDEPNQRHSSLTKKYDKYMRFLGPLFQRARAAPSLVVDADGSVREFWGAAPDRPLLCEFLIFRCVGFKGALAP